MGNLEFNEYTRRDLRNLLADKRFWTQPQLPITKRRVISHVSNPRSDETDVLLLTAFENGQLLAYTGILPDVLRNGSQAPVKFGWGTTWWVDKQSEHRGYAALKILFMAMGKYSKRIAVSNFSADTKRVLDATKRFQEFARFELTYFMMALPPSWRVWSPLTKWVAAAKDRMIFSKKLERCGLKVGVINSFDGALESFMKPWAAADPLARDNMEWQWILQFPWVSAAVEEETIQKSYKFAAFAKDFQQIPILVSRDSAIIAFLFLTLRNGRLSLKYAYYNHADIAEVVAAVQVAITDINPWIFVCADTPLNVALKRAFPFYFARWSKTSLFYTTKELALSVGSRPQFGMGDVIFT